MTETNPTILSDKGTHGSAGVFLAALVTMAATGLADEKPSVDSAMGTGVLIDGIHANDLTTVGLRPDVYAYHETAGYRRPFEYLRAQGIRCDRVTEGVLDAERLAGYRMLFVNLVSAERPPLLVSEIAAIRSFIARGGSMLVITDHTNCYYHAWRLKPLLTELGIESYTDTACDQPPHTLADGPAWVTVTRFDPHPVTEGLRRIALQTGGPVDSRWAVAWTSDQSWADAWISGPFGEENAPGFYGNFVADADEPAGPLGVALAREFERGRIVIVGDQNILGESFLHYADNYRLWLNIVAWLLHDERLRDASAYRQWRRPRIVLHEPADDPVFGNCEPQGLYNSLVLLSRHYWTFASDDLSEPADLVVFAFNEQKIETSVARAAARHLRDGKNILILNAERQLLWDKNGAIGRILDQAAANRPTPRETPGKLILDLPGGGSIHVLGPDGVLDNGVLPPPTSAPSEDQQRQAQMLLDAVRAAIPSAD